MTAPPFDDDENDRPTFIMFRLCQTECRDDSSEVTLTSIDATNNNTFNRTAPNRSLTEKEVKKTVAFWSLLDDDDDDGDDLNIGDDDINKGCASRAAETCIAASKPVLQFIQFFIC